MLCLVDGKSVQATGPNNDAATVNSLLRRSGDHVLAVAAQTAKECLTETTDTWNQSCPKRCITKTAFQSCLHETAGSTCVDWLSRLPMAMSKPALDKVFHELYTAHCPAMEEQSEIVSEIAPLARTGRKEPQMIPITYKMQFDYFASDNRLVITDTVTGMSVLDYRGVFDRDSQQLKTGTVELVQGRTYQLDEFESTGDGACRFTCPDNKGWCSDKCVFAEIASPSGLL